MIDQHKLNNLLTRYKSIILLLGTESFEDLSEEELKDEGKSCLKDLGKFLSGYKLDESLENEENMTENK